MTIYQSNATNGINTGFKSSIQFERANPLCVTLTIIMAIAFALQLLSPSFNNFAASYLALNTQKVFGQFMIWQLVTCVFLHGSILHILLNLIFFWFFGNSLANSWKKSEFLLFFFACGVAGSIFFWLSKLFAPGNQVCVGASGAIFGLMGAYGLVFKHRIIRVFFVIPMKVWLFVILCFILELILLFATPGTRTAHIAHLGGGICGALTLAIIWRLQNNRVFHADCSPSAKIANRMNSLEVMGND